MRFLPPVLWTKGLLLAPQHLQAQDRHHDDALAVQIASLAFCPWGVARLAFDLQALAGGTLVVTAVAGRLPDGLLVDAPGGGPLPPPIPVGEAIPPDQDGATVYLATAEYRPGARNVARSGGAEVARWQAEELRVRDETTGRAEQPIEVAVPQLRLLLEGEGLEGYVTLPIARLMRAPAGGVALDPAFIPPALSLEASPSLLGIAGRLVERLAARSATLSRTRRQRNQGVADFAITDVASFWLLYTVNTHLPTIRHLHEVRRGHPVQLWEAMLALIGALATFSAADDSRALPAYDHLRLGPAFAALEDRLLALLDTAVADAAVSLPLRPVRPSFVSTAIDKGAWLTAPQWFLAVRAPGRQADLIARVAQGCKAGAAEVVETLVQSALPGIPLTHVAHPPAAVPVQLDALYFAIQRDGTGWDAVTRARNFTVYVPADLAGATLELVIVL
jgi:type VI secretion system protein ImpJ